MASAGPERESAQDAVTPSGYDANSSGGTMFRLRSLIMMLVESLATHSNLAC
jgi:hypothetical protein